MNRESNNEALNRLLAILTRSFPMYLMYARPYVARGDRRAMETLEQMAADQTQLSQRVVSFLQSNEGRIETGEFPMEFTDANDLSVSFIVRRAIGYQRQDIAAIEQIVDDLRLFPLAAALAEEALGLAKGHLQTLEELVHEPA